MEISEQDLRALVREAIARHTGQLASPRTTEASPLVFHAHASHTRFTLPASEDGQCVIEPAVRCNHCGYCLSYGH
jgi:hypothetical protein